MRNNLNWEAMKMSYGLIFRLNDFTLRKYDAKMIMKLQKGVSLSLEHKTPSQEPQNISLGKVIAGLSYKVDKNTKTAL